MATEARPQPSRSTNTLLAVVVAVAVLYFAREVFIPLALAILLSFLLAPLVIRLRHWRLGRVPAALIVVHLAFVIVGGAGLLLATQFADLAHKLPGYQENMHKKLNTIRTSGGGLLTKITRLTHNISEQVMPAEAAQPPARNGPPEEKPVPVEIRKTPFAPLETAQKVLGSVLSIALTAAIVIVFVIFMLIQREDLRDRIIRLAGAGRLHVTTQALDDAAGRLSRYLLAQLVVNVGFGCCAGVALYFIGVPNPFLWGVLATILRYIPYLGIWIAAALPALIAFAVEVGWVKVPLIFGIYFGIDLIMYNFVEPYLYGSSTGISPVAILVAAVFWTWLWGPVGLLLATPLTVCVVVIGRYFPSMEFLSVLLSDEEVLGPETKFYQRMLAMNLEEATEIAENFLKGRSMEELEDKVIIPALIMAEEDRHRGRLDHKREQFIHENTRILMEHLSESSQDLIAGKAADKSKPEETAAKLEAKEADDKLGASVVCIPARDEADEIAASMISELLNKRGIATRLLSCAALAGECLEEMRKGQARIACVTVVPPHGYMNARYMCRRLHDEFPDLKVVAAILTEDAAENIKERHPKIQADEVATTLKQAVASVIAFMPERDPNAVATNENAPA